MGNVPPPIDASTPAASTAPRDMSSRSAEGSDSGVPDEIPEHIAAEVRAVGKLDAIPTILQVLCSSTGLGFAAVARVSRSSWTACVVQDDMNFGLMPGSQLDVQTTLCFESMLARAPIVINHASKDPTYCKHPGTSLYGIESYISIPVILNNGRHFGSLFAIDRKPTTLSDPKTLFMFMRFAHLIASQIDQQLARDTAVAVLTNERLASELREQFIAILGHDLRSPLQAVQAVGELLARKLTDPTEAAIAARIKPSVQRMSALIDDVLDFARGRLGGGIGVQIHLTDNLGAGLEAVIKEMQDGNPHRQILSTINVTRAVPCDRGRVQQIASNLIGNALTHGSMQSPIEIRASNNEAEFVLEVWNQGEPIPVGSLGKIFEPFWRQSIAVDRQGLGLGLHICSQIVRAHGGKMSVTSTRDAGTRFTARLPLQPAS